MNKSMYIIGLLAFSVAVLLSGIARMELDACQGNFTYAPPSCMMYTATVGLNVVNIAIGLVIMALSFYEIEDDPKKQAVKHKLNKRVPGAEKPDNGKGEKEEDRGHERRE